MLKNPTLCLLFASTLAFAAGCGGSSTEDGSGTVDQSVGTRVGSGSAPPPDGASGDDGDDADGEDDLCDGDRAAHIPRCQGERQNAYSPSPSAELAQPE